jgi:hypothetical protein
MFGLFLTELCISVFTHQLKKEGLQLIDETKVLHTIQKKSANSPSVRLNQLTVKKKQPTVSLVVF